MSRLVSVNIGKIRTLNWKERPITTGIFKSSVDHEVHVNKLGIEDDEQADLKNHGGIHKSLYSYSLDHYDFWKTQIDLENWDNGLFGENLTLDTLNENEVFIGDQYELGSTLLEVTGPRIPCFKLELKLGISDIVRKFAEARRPGVYYRVLKEGDINKGDKLLLQKEDEKGLSVNFIADFVLGKIATPENAIKIINHNKIDPALLKSVNRILTQIRG